MKPIFKWTFWQRRWSTIWWSLGLSAFVALQLGFYPSFKKDADQLNQTLTNLPSTVKSLIGDSGNYFSPENYLNSRVFYLVVPILLVVMMIGLGSSLLAREEQDETIEYLLSRPVSRTRLLLGMAFCGLAISALVAFIAFLVCLGLSKVVGLPNSPLEIGAATLLCYLMCGVFGAFAFMLTAIGKAARGAAIGLTIGVFVTSYVLTGLAGTVDWIQWPAKLLPYYHLDTQRMLSGDYTWGPVMGFALAILALGVISVIGFRRRDLG